MHWVNRGAEPSGLSTIRTSNTQRWVDYYQNGIGRKPNDRKWIDFREDLKQVFSGLCGYCEQTCNGETDHFRPTSLFPQLIYEWTNWIWACHDCNHAKSDKWPSVGYIDPCENPPPEGPEKYFEFDLQTGEILPKQGITPNESAKAWQMIDDLKLSGDHHLKNRRAWVLLLSELLSVFPKSLDVRQRIIISKISDRSTPLSSISRQVIREFGF